MMDDLLQEMIDPAPVHRDAPRRRRLWTTVTIVGLAAIGATTLTTSAIFTDNDSTSAKIETGTVDLAIGQSVPFAFTPQNLAPGDSTYVPLQVQSNGSLALRYSISFDATTAVGSTTDPTLSPAATTGDLRDVLVLSAYDLPQAQCSATTFPATAPTALGTATSWTSAVTPLVGSVAQGQDAGDRPLAAGGSEWLCFKVDFPLSADNSYQDTAVTLGLTFNAEQTANNG
ncbi:TasA family protein [Cellulomonas sp. ICMP 17802]|uniref:TasA family protein n=1 Tax=Cellulomonas sp. ICMP 17802 TaxID=3239199 RepID=UPI00351BE460